MISKEPWSFLAQRRRSSGAPVVLHRHGLIHVSVRAIVRAPGQRCAWQHICHGHRFRALWSFVRLLGDLSGAFSAQTGL